MKNAAGILLVIYLFFLVPWLAGALIDAAAGVKKGEIYQAHMQMDLLLCLEYFGVLRYFYIVAVH